MSKKKREHSDSCCPTQSFDLGGRFDSMLKFLDKIPKSLIKDQMKDQNLYPSGFSFFRFHATEGQRVQNPQKSNVYPR